MNKKSKLQLVDIVPKYRGDVPNVDKFKFYFNKKGMNFELTFIRIIIRHIRAYSRYSYYGFLFIRKFVQIRIIRIMVKLWSKNQKGLNL
jgi:hypothetical protein